jgi:hypothetical protein
MNHGNPGSSGLGTMTLGVVINVVATVHHFRLMRGADRG